MSANQPFHTLSASEIYSLAQEELGRRPDVRDRHGLRKAANRPGLIIYGQEMFPTLHEKAAALLHALAAHHLFFDGNKRTATRAVIRLLEENGWRITAEQDALQIFVLEVAQGSLEIPEIAGWLTSHSAAIPGSPRHETRFLTVDELVYINEQMPTIGAIHKILRGMQRVRVMDLLEAAAGRPAQTAFGEDAYPTLPDKAAALLHSLARNHPFADGNKRTATIAAIFMLTVNGMRVIWDPARALDQIVAVAEGQLSAADFAAWLCVTPTDACRQPDAARDKALIAYILAEHAWLLDQLANC